MANDKRQIEHEQIKTISMHKKLHETANLCVEVMNSKRQVRGKLRHQAQIRVCR